MATSTVGTFRGRTNKAAVIVAAGTMLMALAACGDDSTTGNEDEPEAQADSYPSEPLEWIVPYGPTSGTDAVTRQLISLLGDKYPEDITVKNIEGGSGSQGYSYLLGKAGNPYTISSAGSNLYTTPLVSETSFTYEDFTPVGLVATADQLLMVPGDAPWATFEEFAEAAKNERLTVGTVNVASTSFLVQASLAAQAGYSQDPVPFPSNGELQAALLSGSIDTLIASPNDVLPHVESGAMRALGYSGPERLDFMPDVPTFEELGLTVDVYTPYAIFLPPDVGDEVRQWWVDALTEVVEMPEYKEWLDSQYISHNYVLGEDFDTRVVELASAFEDRLRAVGAIE